MINSVQAPPGTADHQYVTFRVMVKDGEGLRPLAGMRLATSRGELDEMLENLRAMCPEDEFTFEEIK